MSSKPYGILAMNPDKYREIDGVVFDLASYARHCQPPEEKQSTQTETQNTENINNTNNEQQNHAPAAVFAVDPFPEGWYPEEENRPPVPIMGGAVPPVGTFEERNVSGETVTVTRTVFVPAGSGSGSGSYMTSYTTSYRSSGSGSYRFGSGTFWVGGYGLELV